MTFKVFQFPPNMAPRMDGNPEDWNIVPDDYAIGMDQFVDTEQSHGAKIDRKNLDVKVKAGWVKGQNRLYFLYEVYDNYWDFSLAGLHNDIFEVVVDGDLSGGPLIDQYHRDVWRPEVVGVAAAVLDPRIDRETAQRQTHGVQAQNYHIFTPPGPGKNWAMQWGCPQYGIDLPYSEHAYNYNFKPGEAGKLILEFYKRQGRKSRSPYRRPDPLKASPQARSPSPQTTLFHELSRAEGPSQQTTNCDGLPHRLVWCPGIDWTS